MIFLDLTVWVKTKYFFNFFFNILEKTGYFNTGFIFLWYKNTNHYDAKLIEKYTRKYFFLD